MTDQSFADAVRAGYDAYRRADLTEALRLYEAALSLNADHAEALSLYGAALTSAGRIGEAERPLSRAVELEPSQPGFHVNLADFYLASGETGRAIELLKTVTGGWPDYAHAWRKLGEAHIVMQEFRPAADALDEALKRNSDDYLLAVRLANALAAAGDYKAAEGVLGHAERLQPEGVPAARLHVEMSKAQRNWDYVGLGAKRITAAKPDDVQAWRDLSLAYYETGRYAAAWNTFEKILEIEGRTPDNLAVYARLALDSGRIKEARDAVDEAEAMDPEHFQVLSVKSLALLQEGATDEAAKYAERAVEINPEHIPGYPHLSALRKGRLSEEQAKTLERLSNRSDLTTASRSMASFVLAHHLDAARDTDAAFAEYKRANELARENRTAENILYEPIAASSRSRRLMEALSPQEEAGPTVNEPEGEAAPIFIIGAPRSGTTLVETVIGAHSRVAVGGELPMMNGIIAGAMEMRNAFAPLAASELEDMAKAYRKGAPTLAGESFYTDKNLRNLEAAGLVAQMFPSATIIHVQRNPLETGLSIYRNEFTKYWPFTDDLENIGHYLGECARLADHWRRVLGERFHTVQYEDFAGDFEAGARALLTHVGLDWETACGDPARAGRVAGTISAAQVREPVEPQTRRAGAYEKHLAPLRAALEAAGVDLDTGALKA